MIASTNVLNRVAYSLPPYIIVNHEESTGIGANTSSSQTIGLNLPAISSDANSYRINPNNVLSGSSYAIELVNFAIACDSTSYIAVILNIDDITKVNTINEVYRYSSINMNTRQFNKIIYMNRDTTLSNYMYLYIINNDPANATGTIYTELTYVTLQDRAFS